MEAGELRSLCLMLPQLGPLKQSKKEGKSVMSAFEEAPVSTQQSGQGRLLLTWEGSSSGRDAPRRLALCEDLGSFPSWPSAPVWSPWAICAWATGWIGAPLAPLQAPYWFLKQDMLWVAVGGR